MGIMQKENWSWRFRYLKLILSLVAAGGWLVTVLGFAARLWWPFEILSHFRWQYFVFLSVWSSFLAVLRIWRLAGITALFAIVNLGLLVPLFVRRDALPQGEATLQVLSANVLRSNRQPEALERLVEERQPDVIVIVEATKEYMDGLTALQRRYPYQERAINEERGVVLLSQIPLAASESFTLTEESYPTVVAYLEGEASWTIVGTHPPPPRGRSQLKVRTAEMEALAGWLQDQPGPLVLVGDFNITTWSPYFQDFLTQSGLKDARKGFGLQNSWPVLQPLLRIPIDQALVTEDVVVHRFAAGPDVASDHFPILVDVSLKERSLND